MTYIPKVDKLNCLKGNVAKHEVWIALGERDSIGTTTSGEDIWLGTATSIPTPSASGEQMTVVSSNNADNGATTTGVLTLRIHYLDASGDQQTEDITLNGTTPVNTVATDIIFVNDMYTLTVGSNGVAEGDITIYKLGASSTIYNMIAQGGNKSLVPNRMVPSGYKFYLMVWNASESKDKEASFRIRSTDMYGTRIAGVFCFKGGSLLSKSTTGDLEVGCEIPALSIIKVSAWGVAAGGRGTCSYWGYLVED